MPGDAQRSLRPGLTGKILFNPFSDQYTNGYGFRYFAEVWLRSGKGFPQWDPFLQGGVPFVAGMHGDAFYPTFLLRMMIGTAEGITWEFPIHVLAGLFTYFFLRAWRLPFVASVIGGLAYMMSGSIAGLALPGHDGKLFVAALFPLCLHLLTRGIRDGKIWAWGPFALAIGLALLSPHPQLIQYLLLAAGSYSLFLAFATHEGVRKLPTAVAARRFCCAAGGVTLGLLIGAIQFGPLLAYKAYSPRAAGHDWATATSFSFPIEETLNAVTFRSSPGILSKYWGQNRIHFHSDYFGVVALVLMGAAFGASRLKSFKWFWAACGLVTLVWAYGGHTPFYHLIMLVPGTKFFKAPSTIIYITAFSVAVLAAIGAENGCCAPGATRRYAMTWAIAAGVFAVFVLHWRISDSLRHCWCLDRPRLSGANARSSRQRHCRARRAQSRRRRAGRVAFVPIRRLGGRAHLGDDRASAFAKGHVDRTCRARRRRPSGASSDSTGSTCHPRRRPSRAIPRPTRSRPISPRMGPGRMIVLGEGLGPRCSRSVFPQEGADGALRSHG